MRVRVRRNYRRSNKSSKNIVFKCRANSAVARRPTILRDARYVATMRVVRIATSVCDIISDITACSRSARTTSVQTAKTGVSRCPWTIQTKTTFRIPIFLIKMLRTKACPIERPPARCAGNEMSSHYVSSESRDEYICVAIFAQCNVSSTNITAPFHCVGFVYQLIPRVQTTFRPDPHSRPCVENNLCRRSRMRVNRMLPCRVKSETHQKSETERT